MKNGHVTFPKHKKGNPETEARISQLKNGKYQIRNEYGINMVLTSEELIAKLESHKLRVIWDEGDKKRENNITKREKVFH